MDYTKFITGYKLNKDKDDFIKKHITKQYVPYATKLTLAQSIAKTCTHVTIDGKEVYKKNTPSQYFATVMQLITQYTDIQYDISIINQVYDALVESGAMQVLLSSIPESEVTEFRTLIDMCVSDIYENERDVTSFLETKIEAINLTVNQMLSSLNETISAFKPESENNEDDFPMNKVED